MNTLSLSLFAEMNTLTSGGLGVVVVVVVVVVAVVVVVVKIM